MKLIMPHATKIALIILTIFTFISLCNAWNDSATFDEVAHIPAGYSYVTQWDYRLNPEHPPLLKSLAGIPLLFLNLHFDTTQKFWTTADTNGEYGQWAAGRHLLYGAGNNPDMIIFWARVPLVLLSALFGLFLFLWGRHLTDVRGGLLALLLYVLSPGILGHNHYVTTDVGSAFFIALALFFFIHFLKHATWRNVIVAGVFFGLAQTTKFSALLLVPIIGSTLILYPLLRITPHNITRITDIAQFLLKGIVAGLVSIVIIWLVYAPFTFTMPAAVLDTIAPIKTQAENGLIDSIAITFITKANTLTVTRPLAMYAQGIIQVIHRVDGGNGAYFFGQVSSNAFPLYFPAVFIMKETLGFLVLLCLALYYAVYYSAIYSLRNIRQHRIIISLQEFITFHIAEIVLYSFVILYIYSSVTGNLNIGYRHLFPIIPLIYLLVSLTLTRTTTKFTHKKRPCYQRNIIIAIGTLLFFMIIEIVGAYPYYMSFFNIAIGGPQNGYHYVTDSNADWGQDLKRLRNYLIQHPEIDKIRIDYFGGGNLDYYLGNRYIPWWDSKRPIEPGWYAISVNYRQGSIHDSARSDDDSYRWLLDYHPVAQVGTSILIYHIAQ